MAGKPTKEDIRTGPPEASDERYRAALELANSNRAMASALGGTSVGILTFALFFLYAGFLRGEFDPSLFRLTLGAIVASLFLFSYTAIYDYRLTEALVRHDPRAPQLSHRADVTFLLGLIALMVTPVLILMTAKLWDLGLLALLLWLGAFVLLVRGWLERH